MKTNVQIASVPHQSAEDALNRVAGDVGSDSSGINIQGLTYETPRKEEILKGINLNVPKGTIFGLLGPSGCGKTTLLRCIVGSLRPQCGSISMFGQPPGRETAKIPGSGIGYMPQENTLYENMTIEEVLTFYGRVFFLSIEDLSERIKRLMEIIELPDKCRYIKNLSGGQKRRVSFAIALIHRPGLLILDEPTSGVDPLLREKIWLHLIYISLHQGSTIIITTHYIEEARRSHTVGFMRNGRILTQGNPEKLLMERGEKTLENVFLNICRKQSQAASTSSSFVADLSGEKIEFKGLVPSKTFVADPKVMKKRTKEWFLIFAVLVWKHLVSDIREPMTIGFQYVIPIMSTLLCALCIGGQPFNIPLGVVDGEPENDLGQLFVQGLDPYLFEIHNFADVDEALETARNRGIWGYLHIEQGFSDGLWDILFSGDDVDFFPTKLSQIHLHADLTDRIITNTMHRYLERSFVTFVRKVVQGSSENGNSSKNVPMPQFMANPPIRMGKPIYGGVINKKQSYRGYRDFMLPGLIVNITYAIAYALTALSLINERKKQTFERNYVAGVKPAQMLLAHALSRLILMSLYLFLIIYLPIVSFDMPVDCIHILHSLPLLILLNLSGMTYGMVISALCDSIEECAIFSAGTFFTILFMSGTLWPVESIPGYFRWICEYAPTTAANQAFRDIWYKQWSLTSPRVSMAHSISMLWTLAFFLIGLKFFRLSK